MSDGHRQCTAIYFVGSRSRFDGYVSFERCTATGIDYGPFSGQDFPQLWPSVFFYFSAVKRVLNRISCARVLRYRRIFSTSGLSNNENAPSVAYSRLFVDATWGACLHRTCMDDPETVFR